MSQHLWLADNKDYHRGSANVNRVREWRKRNPDYKRRKSPKTASTLQEIIPPALQEIMPSALQEIIPAQDVDPQQVKQTLTAAQRQELIMAQHLLVVGLIAVLTDCALQDDMVKTIRSFILRGREFLDMESGQKVPLEEQLLPLFYDDQTTPLPRAPAAGAAPL